MSSSSPSYLQVVVVFNGKPLNTLVFTESEVLIGRGADCQILLDNPGASRHHAKLVREGEQIRLVDLGSGNGTTVNGKPITDTVIKANDVITISKFTLTAKLTDTPVKAAVITATSAVGGGPDFSEERTVFLSAQDRARIVEQAQPGARPAAPPAKPAVPRAAAPANKAATVVVFMAGAMTGIVAGWFMWGQ